MLPRFLRVVATLVPSEKDHTWVHLLAITVHHTVPACGRLRQRRRLVMAVAAVYKPYGKDRNRPESRLGVNVRVHRPARPKPQAPSNGPSPPTTWSPPVKRSCQKTHKTLCGELLGSRD